MGIANTTRGVSAARVANAPGGLLRENRRPYVRPYTEFARGGINRFRPPEPGARLFRVG
jgi:hypothetical protein